MRGEFVCVVSDHPSSVIDHFKAFVTWWSIQTDFWWQLPIPFAMTLGGLGRCRPIISPTALKGLSVDIQASGRTRRCLIAQNKQTETQLCVPSLDRRSRVGEDQANSSVTEVLSYSVGDTLTPYRLRRLSWSSTWANGHGDISRRFHAFLRYTYC